MPKKKLIELLIDEDADAFGVEAISLVKYPAIESNFIYFSKQGKTEKTLYAMASVDEEKRTLIGPALIPDKHIPRYDEFSDEEYDVYFSKQTVQKASELFLKTHRTSEHTFEHESPVEDVHVVESWIVSNPDLDKARHFGLEVPEGTWMVRVQVENDEMWKFVKEQKVSGFSIEGYFLDKLETMAARPEPSLGRKLKSMVTGRKLYAEIAVDNGATFATEDDEFTAGVEVYKIGPDGTAVEVENGAYKTKAGTPFEIYDGVVTEWDGEVAAVEQKDESETDTIETLKNEYAEKMKQYLSKRIQLSALNDWWIFLDPYDYNFRGQGFYIYPFQHNSYSDYLSALEDAKQAVPQVEEWENADSDGFFEYTTPGSGISKENWENLKELADFAGSNRIPFEVVVEADSYFGKPGARYLEDAYSGYNDRPRDFAYDLIQDTGLPQNAEAYFNYDQFGYDLRIGGSLDYLYEDDPERLDEVLRMDDRSIGEEYVDMMGGVDELGKDLISHYFDYMKFGNDLMYDYVSFMGYYFFRH